ncbi:hypothetical protein B0T10DRAFT_410007 [Thelonectria olida]|uniref:Transcription factor domain-containing protein n=1 Tax=Thelonectria olida TaxID=1576542 RepID=A0A9P8VXM5_9HYPO|nr:hypothetical protein B0T10DRAFT_410007 [Thelonectria olida]
MHQAASIPTSLTFNPENHVLRSFIPQTRNSLEFELTVRHPIAYPTLYPVEFQSLPLDTLLNPTRISRSQLQSSSTWYSRLGLPSTSQPAPLHIDSASTELVVGPAPCRPLVDDRLRNLSIAFWTDVHMSNDLAARIISLYLEVDYPVLPIFNAELFLDDLLRQRHYFCSRLLVCALMSWACQAFTSISPETRELSVAFFSEADTILADQAQLNTLTTVSALQFLCMTAITQGRDDIASRYLRRGIAIGKAMGLFGLHPGKASADAWVDGYRDWRIAASYTSWGLESPPSLPTPVQVEHQSAPHVGFVNTHTFHIESFQACCELWTIFNGVLWTRYGEDGGGSLYRRSLAYAEEVYSRLLDWAGRLPLELIRCLESNHAVMMMHVYFHAIVTDVFRPFVHGTEQDTSLSSFATPQASAEGAYAASINQLKRLLLLYKLNFRTATLSVHWQTSIVYVANAIVREAGATSVEWRYYLYLCIAGLEDLYGSFRAFGLIVKALLGMALEHNAITPEEVKRVRRELKELGQPYEDTNPLGEDRGVEVASWIINLDLALTDPEAAQGSNLAARFDSMVLQDGEESN